MINESLGHAVGDALLVAVGERLQRCLRPGDTVARFGGDEFGVILDGIGGVDDARRTADRILAELSAPFSLGDRDWYVNASLGIAMAWPGQADAGRRVPRGRGRARPGEGDARARATSCSSRR